MNSLNNLLNNLRERLENITDDAGTVYKTIQETIGDSTDNNRVPSVNQVIRYLTSKNASKLQRETGVELRKVYRAVRTDLYRSRFNSRSDAYDINEFFENVNNVI